MGGCSSTHHGAQLYDSASKGDTRGVREALSAGAPAGGWFATDTLGGDQSPLMAAAAGGHLAAVKLIAGAGAAVDEKRPSDGQTALMLAAGEGHLPVVSALLAAGAAPDEADDGGATALVKATAMGHAWVAKALLEAGASANARDMLDGNTALTHAAAVGPSSAVTMLVDAGANVNETNYNGQTALLNAANTDYRGGRRGSGGGGGGGDDDARREEVASGQAAIVECLLRAGAEVNVRNHDLYTPLMVAAFRGHHGIVRALADAGADLNLRAERGHTAVLLAASGGHSSVVELLIDRGAELDHSDDVGHTALSRGVTKGHGFIVEALVAAGASVTTKDTASGFSPLHWACQTNHVGLLRSLVQAGADVHARSYEGETPLAVAARCGQPGAVRYLVEAGARPDDPNSEGRTPLLVAAAARHYETVRALVAVGADTSFRDARGVTLASLAAGDALLEAASAGRRDAAGAPPPPPRKSLAAMVGDAAAPAAAAAGAGAGAAAAADDDDDEDKRGDKGSADDDERFSTSWSAADVRSWLARARLERYADAFSAAGVDGAMLAELGKDPVLLGRELRISDEEELAGLARAVRELTAAAAAAAAPVAFERPAMDGYDMPSEPPADADTGMPQSDYDRAVVASAASRPRGGSSHQKGRDAPRAIPKPRVIKYEELQVGEQVGRGAFGTVYRGEWRGVTVAVKKLHRTELDEDQVDEFLREAGLMELLGGHPCVIRLAGVCTSPPCIVTEFSALGSVQELLARPDGADLVGGTAGIVRMARDAASGVLHLHAEGVVHRDLAARNLLIGERLDAKVCDFGMSRLKTTAVGTTDGTFGPVKWMAPEALVRSEYSEKSDAWSFGVLLWEMLSRRQPYEGEENVEVAIRVAGGHAGLEPPAGCPPALASLMRDCWQADPASRPTFQDILLRLDTLAQEMREADAAGAASATYGALPGRGNHQ